MMKQKRYYYFFKKEPVIFLIISIIVAFFFLFVTDKTVRDNNIMDYSIWLGTFFSLLVFGFLGEKMIERRKKNEP